ncbi:hypothetical protein NMG60_11017263 [Bertholletia excelsa]
MAKKSKSVAGRVGPERPSSHAAADQMADDLISKLPDEILLIILSRMPSADAARTTSLSHRWQRLWAFVAVLDFGSAEDALDIQCRLNSKFDRSFRYWVNRVLDSHMGHSVDRLRICLEAEEIGSSTDVARWIRFAVEKSVRELDLVIVRPTFSAACTPLFPILEFPNINSLNSLSLEHRNLTEEHVNYFLSHCPSLETLSLRKSSSLWNLLISGSSLKLKHLEISYCSQLKTLEISADNLVSFKYCGPKFNLSLCNAPSLVEVSFLESYCLHLAENRFCEYSTVLPQIQRLSLTLNYHWLTQFPEVHPLTTLNTLELNLKVWDSVSCFVLFTSMMERLSFLHKFSINLFWAPRDVHERKQVKLVTEQRHHYLKVVELVGFVRCSIDTAIMRYLVKNAVSLKKITIVPCQRAWVDSLDVMTDMERQTARDWAHRFAATLPPLTNLVVL